MYKFINLIMGCQCSNSTSDEVASIDLKNKANSKSSLKIINSPRIDVLKGKQISAVYFDDEENVKEDAIPILVQSNEFQNDQLSKIIEESSRKKEISDFSTNSSKGLLKVVSKGSTYSNDNSSIRLKNDASRIILRDGK